MNRTLEEARAAFAAAIADEGMRCPCCDRWGKINPQHLDASKARALLWLRARHLLEPNAWVHCASTGPRWMVGKNMFSTMKYWRLIEAAPVQRDDGGKSRGYWRITPTGLDFAEGRSTLPKTAWVFDDNVRDFTGPEVSIRECTQGFDYEEMMNSVFNERMDL